ncbi:MAG: YebC/PmpR family DNA-binding transcriptional regulator [Candidatus Fermentithermobacillus carboniphilus]|uniref:Probable transcriptional regulatory protein IMF26_10825 n=1 Tax=Candidatus Fermentithermobacillus carboniphilus TaxID=3085328 RepID=A0AAT9LE26_9FIRM|nr:MAG: YebC/PmpR family DNA-binding transcriptional regulator [Candidatus Fermentithermobacillus carboniphilus]
MSGHSKWANIKRHKAKVDAQRSNIISKALRDIMLAARHGGGNPESNFRLKVAIERAREADVPLDSINRAIKRGTGEIEGGQLEEITYEGYGPGGTAVLVEAATDNRNRTASEVRYIFSKHGGKLAEVGAVAWMFEQKGFIAIEKDGLSEDDALAMAIEAGALDLKTEDDSYEIYTRPEDVEAVKEKLEANGARVQVAEVTMVPKTTVRLEGDDAEKMLRLFDALEAHDDVSRVYANFDIPEEILRRGV